MPTKTVRCSSITPTLQMLGSSPSSLSRCGTAVVETALAVSGFRAPSGRGLASTLSLAGLVSAGNSNTRRSVERYNIVKESLRGFAKRHGVNPKTVAKWKARSSAFRPADRTQAKPRSTVLSAEEEAVVVAFRRHTLLPLDDCLYALAADDPPSDGLVSSPVSATPRDLPACRRSKAKPPPNANSRPIRSAIFIPTSPKFEPPKANSTCSSPSTERRSSPSSRCTRRWRAPHRGRLPAPPRSPPSLTRSIPSSPTMEPTSPRQSNTSSAATRNIKAALEAGELVWAHAFEYAFARERRRSPADKAQASMDQAGQVERMNRTIKDATVKRYFYQHPRPAASPSAKLRQRLQLRQAAQNPPGPHPHEFVCKAWTSEPQRFKLNPLQQMPGLNN